MFTSTKSSFSPPLSSSEYENGIEIPVYGVILLSLTIILMFIVICCLCFMLYRIKNGRKFLFVNADNVEARSEYVRQQSDEVFEPVPLKTITFDSPFKQSDILSMVDIDEKEKKRIETDVLKPPRPERIKPTVNGKMLPKQPVITPDQMNKLCEAVLLKMKRNESRSLTHLNELLKDKDSKEYHTKGIFPEHEDDSENYDVVPKPKKLHTSGDEDDIEVYDCPTRSNDFRDSDPQDYYDMAPEDTYQNIRFI